MDVNDIIFLGLYVLEMCMNRSDFFQVAFTKCVHIRTFLYILCPELHCGPTKAKYLCTVICPQKITHAHKVAGLCSTKADILNPCSIGHL